MAEKKLTKKQREFLSALESGRYVEILPHEQRTARSLAKRGLIEITPQDDARLARPKPQEA